MNCLQRVTLDKKKKKKEKRKKGISDYEEMFEDNRIHQLDHI
jgi:hypothetical protein